MEFYRTLANDPSRSDGRYQLVVVGPEPVTTLQLFLDRYRVRPDKIASVYDPKIFATPTLVLANRGGLIKQVWVGEQSLASRAAILALLHNGSAS